MTHLINAPKLLANQQLGGDSLVGVLVEGLQERSSTEELRRFIMVDNHEAVMIGDLKKTPESLSVVEPNFSADVPEAEVREDRAAKRRRRYTANFHQYHQCWETIDGDRRWWTRIGTSSAKPIHKGVQGAEWENLHGKFVEKNKAVNFHPPSGSSTARTLLEDEGGQRKR